MCAEPEPGPDSGSHWLGWRPPLLQALQLQPVMAHGGPLLSGLLAEKHLFRRSSAESLQNGFEGMTGFALCPVFVTSFPGRAQSFCWGQSSIETSLCVLGEADK